MLISTPTSLWVPRRQEEHLIHVSISSTSFRVEHTVGAHEQMNGWIDHSWISTGSQGPCSNNSKWLGREFHGRGPVLPSNNSTQRERRRKIEHPGGKNPWKVPSHLVRMKKFYSWLLPPGLGLCWKTTRNLEYLFKMSVNIYPHMLKYSSDI